MFVIWSIGIWNKKHLRECTRVIRSVRSHQEMQKSCYGKYFMTWQKNSCKSFQQLWIVPDFQAFLHIFLAHIRQELAFCCGTLFSPQLKWVSVKTKPSNSPQSVINRGSLWNVGKRWETFPPPSLQLVNSWVRKVQMWNTQINIFVIFF